MNIHGDILFNVGTVVNVDPNKVSGDVVNKVSGDIVNVSGQVHPLTVIIFILSLITFEVVNVSGQVVNVSGQVVNNHDGPNFPINIQPLSNTDNRPPQIQCVTYVCKPKSKLLFIIDKAIY